MCDGQPYFTLPRGDEISEKIATCRHHEIWVQASSCTDRLQFRRQHATPLKMPATAKYPQQSNMFYSPMVIIKCKPFLLSIIMLCDPSMQCRVCKMRKPTHDNLSPNVIFNYPFRYSGGRYYELGLNYLRLIPFVALGVP